MKSLIVTIQRADKTIGGMANRFVSLYSYLHQKDSTKYFLLTTGSLKSRFVDKKVDLNDAYILRDMSVFYKLKLAFLPLRILLLSLLNNIKSIHFAGIGSYITPFLPIYKLFGIKTSITFASASIEMAAYNNERASEMWHKMLRSFQNIDVLNPTHTLPEYSFDKFVSPCSFPVFLRTNNFTKEAFENVNRKNLIVFCGAFSETKNPILALKGFDKFYQKHGEKLFDTQLVLFGKGLLENEVDELIAKINKKYKKEIIYREDYDKLFDVLPTSKIFLSLQDYDNYPSQSLMEGMLFCNSVIATNYGDTSKIVLEENNNFLLDSKESEKLGDLMFQLLSSWKLNTKNRKYILENHNIEKFAEYFSDMMKNLS